MKIKIFGGLLVAALAITSIAEAQQTHTKVIDQRHRRQEARITAGVRSGRLTRSEAYRLRQRERKLKYDERMAKADGHITRAERRHLRREENRISRSIARETHNGRVS